MTNVFYLINVILQFQPNISTNSPLASLVPLCFVIFVGILKEFIADMKRWSQDRKTNNLLFKRLIDNGNVNEFVTTRSDQLKVGDIILVEDETIMPADCVLLHTVEKHGECFVQTA